MFKTVNNWICKRFIRHLFSSDIRACFNIYSNFFDRLDVSIQNRMLCYFFNELALVYGCECMLPDFVLQLDIIKKEPVFAVVYLRMLRQYNDYITNTKRS